jgi:hypothetical protein
LGLSLALTLSDTVLQRGESDTVTVTLANTNDFRVSIEEGGCPLLMYITDARGVRVVPSGGDYVCIAIISRVFLQPGERQTRTFLWGTAPFAPGAYSIYGTFSTASSPSLQLMTPRTSVRLN